MLSSLLDPLRRLRANRTPLLFCLALPSFVTCTPPKEARPPSSPADTDLPSEVNNRSTSDVPANLIASEDTEDTPLSQLSSTGTSDSPGWIGIGMKQTEGGVVVANVLRTSPAASAGLRVGDRLVRINARTVNTPEEVGAVVQALPPGSKATFDIRRDDEVRLLHATVEAKPDREEMLRRELVGQSAPSISELRTVQGAVVPSWSRLRGHPVILEFWASWCVACRALAPTLNEWHEEMSPLGVHILGITADEFDEATRASQGLAFPTFHDEGGEVTWRYQGTALPTLVVVDKRGVVADVMVGLDFERLPKLKALALDLAQSSTTQ